MAKKPAHVVCPQRKNLLHLIFACGKECSMDVRQALNRWIDENATQSAFAKTVGISNSHLSLLLRGKRGASYETAKKIENATDGDINADNLMLEKPKRGGRQ